MKAYVICPVHNRAPETNGDLAVAAFVHQHGLPDTREEERLGQPLRYIVHAVHWKFAVSTTRDVSIDTLNLAIAMLADFFDEAVPIDAARASLHPDAQRTVALHYDFARLWLTNAAPNEPVIVRGSDIQAWADASRVAVA